MRTAGGRKGGRLSGWHPADLAGQVLDALVERAHADPSLIDDVIMGCVSQVGEQASNVARNAVLSSSTKSGMLMQPQLVDLTQSHVRDKIVAREPAENWSFGYLNDSWANHLP